MSFFTYKQNEQFNGFMRNKHVNEWVIVEADSAEEANRFADAEAGLYFNGCFKDLDHPDDGDRWSIAIESDADPVPMIYDVELTDDMELTGFYQARTNPFVNCYVYFKDGTRKSYSVDL